MLPLADLFGQSNYSFRYLNTGDGLSNSNVRVLMEDHHGGIWIGTEAGLNFFDGYGVRVLPLAQNAEVGSRLENVYSIQEDNQGNIWVLTSSMRHPN